MTPIQIERSRQALRQSLERLQSRQASPPPKPAAFAWDKERLSSALRSWRDTIRQQQQLIDEQAKAIANLEARLAQTGEGTEAREKALKEREEAFEAEALEFAELVRQFEECTGDSRAAAPLTFHGSRAVPIERR